MRLRGEGSDEDGGEEREMRGGRVEEMRSMGSDADGVEMRGERDEDEGGGNDEERPREHLGG